MQIWIMKMQMKIQIQPLFFNWYQNHSGHAFIHGCGPRSCCSSISLLELICPCVQFLFQGVEGYLIPRVTSQTTAMLFSHTSIYGQLGEVNICGPPQFVNHRCHLGKNRFFNAKYIFDDNTVKIKSLRDIQKGTKTLNFDVIFRSFITFIPCLFW